MLRDLRDDTVSELAAEAACDCIVSRDVENFAGADRWTTSVEDPRD